MIWVRALVLLSLSLNFNSSAFAQNARGTSQPDVHTQEALTKTQDLLRDSQKRQQAIREGGPAAQKADETVQRLTGGDPQLNQMIYSLSADVFANLVNMSHGDPKLIQQILEDVKKNPAAFAESFTPEQRQKLREISERLAPANQRR